MLVCHLLFFLTAKGLICTQKLWLDCDSWQPDRILTLIFSENRLTDWISANWHIITYPCPTSSSGQYSDSFHFSPLSHLPHQSPLPTLSFLILLAAACVVPSVQSQLVLTQTPGPLWVPKPKQKISISLFKNPKHVFPAHMQVTYNNISTSLHCSSKSRIIWPLVMVCIQKYISFNGIFKGRAGRNKHYCVPAVRSSSHIAVTKRLKPKIHVRATRVTLRNEQLLKCIYNMQWAVQVPIK